MQKLVPPKSPRFSFSSRCCRTLLQTRRHPVRRAASVHNRTVAIPIRGSLAESAGICPGGASVSPQACRRAESLYRTARQRATRWRSFKSSTSRRQHEPDAAAWISTRLRTSRDRAPTPDAKEPRRDPTSARTY